ncbi:MAG: ATP-binding protein [Verrucomicrobiota bacterium]|nr:ATP-binding protein [Verrucomicrobiota bacterium]
MLQQNRSSRLARVASHVAAGLVIAIGLTVLAGWFFRMPVLRHFVPGYVSMNPVSACCFLALGVSLLLLFPRNPSLSRKRTGEILAAIVALIGAVRLIAVATGWRSGIDQWLFTGELIGLGEPASRIATRTALNFVLSGLALLLLNFRTARGRRPTEWLCIIASVIAFLALIGYSYGLFLYYKAPDFVPMSLPGATACLLLAIGTLLARPREGMMRVITSDTPAGVLLRLLLPLAVFLPVLLGALRFAGEQAGWYSTRAGVALFTTAFLILFFAAIIWTTRLLFRSDLKRKAAEEKVRLANAELEQRVADRTAELHALNAELIAAGKTKDNFLAALSHELRTPLTPVLMSAAALEQEPRLHAEFREQLAMMRRNIELEARLIDDLLDLTRVAGGKLELHLGTANIHPLLEHTGEIVKSEAAAKSIHVRFDLRARDFNVSGDAARLHQVFWNILKNAIKFTPQNGEVSVETSNFGEQGLRVAICDNGLGIDPAVLPNIFAAFVQGEIAPGRTASGLGLGMAISKKIVELHGGTINAASEGLGRGATFTVELTTIPSLAHPDPSTEQASARTARAYRLLVIEDHPPTLEVLARLLRKEGHDVTTASSVAEALETAADNHFDLVISDIGLPDGNGIDLMVQLTRDYGLRGIALSGYGMDEDLARTKQAGFVAHLVKPINFERLNQVLEQFGRAA